MKNRDYMKAASASSIGAVIGACTHATIGSLGLVGIGTGIGITFGPFVAIGATAGLATYGIYWVGRKVERQSGQNPSGESAS